MAQSESDKVREIEQFVEEIIGGVQKVLDMTVTATDAATASVKLLVTKGDRVVELTCFLTTHETMEGFTSSLGAPGKFGS